MGWWALKSSYMVKRALCCISAGLATIIGPTGWPTEIVVQFEVLPAQLDLNGKRFDTAVWLVY